jgi:hypothetical protein
MLRRRSESPLGAAGARNVSGGLGWLAMAKPSIIVNWLPGGMPGSLREAVRGSR